MGRCWAPRHLARSYVHHHDQCADCGPLSATYVIFGQIGYCLWKMQCKPLFVPAKELDELYCSSPMSLCLSWCVAWRTWVQITGVPRREVLQLTQPMPQQLQQLSSAPSRGTLILRLADLLLPHSLRTFCPAASHLLPRRLLAPGSPLREPQQPASDNDSMQLSDAVRVQRRLFAATAGHSEMHLNVKPAAPAGHARAPPRLRLRLPHEATSLNAMDVCTSSSPTAVAPSCDTPSSFGSPAAGSGGTASSSVATWLATMEQRRGSSRSHPAAFALPALRLDAAAEAVSQPGPLEVAAAASTSPPTLPPPAFVLLGMLN